MNKLVVTVFALLLVQSVLLWTDVRVNWVSNLTLWEDASKKNPTSKVVAEAYSRTLYHSGDFVAARRVARTWLDQHPATPAPTERCTIYLRLLQADSKLGAVAEGMHDAREAMPIGWCQPELTQQIADYLLKTDCTEILALIDKALVQGDKLIGMGDWKFSTSNQKNQLLLRKADAETRCGDPGKRSK